MRLIITDERRPESWKDKYYPILVGFVLGLISTMVIPWGVQVMTTQPDYIVTLDPLSGSAGTLETIDATITIDDNYDRYHWRNYENTIVLAAYETDGRTSPSGVEITFDKPIFKMNGSRQVSSKIHIKPTENAVAGRSIIYFGAIGGDNRVRSSLYYLEVT